ncbi:DUF6701 domain-containing protein [Massilia aurea]|uniref:DUF6701 domain-containing protein n=1 Tax=Massilia aurea TaxID=373040 RepID=UPI002161EE9B|nr:polymer-forming cytoskeletal protein [Massilia aurea]
MYFTSPFSLILRTALALFGLLLAAGAAQAGTTYRFGGTAVYGCSLSGKIYTCPSSAGIASDDRIVIDSGYTVSVRSDFTFGYNQGLTMSGTARLTSTGNLSIADLPPGNLNVSGGSFSAAKTFTAGNQVQTFKADISAASLVLGSGSTLQITGTLASTGPVTIGSNTTITGPVTGTTVSIGTPVRITGDVNASTSLFLGSGSTIDGNVDTGQMTLQASDALITGNAAVDFAKLDWNGRVAKKIICKTGTRPGECDCVDNQSGNPVNTPKGPTCESAKPATAPLHHFQITHDGSGRTCAPESVTVTACANESCSALYKGGAQITLSPGAVAATIDSSGTTLAQVSRNTAGTDTLQLTQGGAKPATTCYNSTSKSTSCAITFASGVSFRIDANHHKAGDSAGAIVTALAPDPATGQCVAAFKNTSKYIAYACQHVTTSADTKGLQLTDNTTKRAATLACATGAAQAVNSRFDADGKAQLTLVYQDVGTLKLLASFDDAQGDTTVTVAPYTFDFSKLPSAPVRAGDNFQVTVTAVNKAGVTTPSFHRSALAAGATLTDIGLSCVGKGSAGLFTGTRTEFNSGVAVATLAWGDVGMLDLKATLSDFLGSKVDVLGTSGETTTCTPTVGPFIPKYFKVDYPAAIKTRTFYYAGEPIPVEVAAMNAQGAITTNYSGDLGLSETVTLTALNPADYAAIKDTSAELKDFTVPASAFKAGLAQAKPAYGPTTAAPIAASILLRASNSGGVVTSGDGKGTYEKARPAVHSGRLRIANAFGRINTPLPMRIEAYYWTGKSWLFNQKDDFTVIPASAFAQVARPKVTNGVAPTIGAVKSAVVLASGRGQVDLTGDRPGWIDLAINLGNDTQPLPCNKAAYPTNSGARLAWLRLPTGCADPSARATFGEQSAEERRIIHVRQVFN